MAARIYYISHTLQETYMHFGEKYTSIGSFRIALTKGYTHLPIYKKQKDIWVLKDKIIDFKPVSTISVSGE